MEPISLIVGALVMGATAAAKNVGGQAVQDAYGGLKKLIADHFKRGRAVEALEEDPSSETQKKALEEGLAKSEAAQNPQTLDATLAKAKDLVQLLQNAPRPELQHALGARIGELEAMNARFGEIEVTGAGSTGLDIGKAKLEGDLTIDKLKVHGPN
jgi:hypothetical protein